MTALLEVAGLAKRYGRLTVVDDLSFSVAEGEAFGIVGPNGAGKSTTLDLVSGVVRPDAGRVHLGGEDVTRLGPAARARAGLGRSYQVPRPFGGMTVFENALVAATFAGAVRRAEAERTALDSLERTGLLGRADEAAGSLRLLDRKRLELARALATRPRVVLLDEIAGGLTEHEVPELVETVRAVRREGVTVVWIEHVVRALLAVADRLLCLTYGKVLAVGGPREVLASPEVRRVYLGSTPEDPPTGPGA